MSRPHRLGWGIALIAWGVGLPTATLFGETLYSEKSLPPEGSSAATPSPLSAEAEKQLIAWMEKLLPVMVQVFDERLALLIEMVGEKKVTRKYTEQEFQEFVLGRLPELFPGQISDVTVKIHPDGFFGSAKLHTNSQMVQVDVRMGVVVVNHRPHTVIKEVKVGVLAPEPLLKQVEARVNQKIDRTRSSLKVRQCELNEGWAMISAELAD